MFQITWTAGVVARDLGLSHAREKQEVVVSYLPLSHIAAQMLDIWVHMKIGSAIYFAQPDALKVRPRAAARAPPRAPFCPCHAPLSSTSNS